MKTDYNIHYISIVKPIFTSNSIKSDSSDDPSLSQLLFAKATFLLLVRELHTLRILLCGVFKPHDVGLFEGVSRV